MITDNTFLPAEHRTENTNTNSSQPSHAPTTLLARHPARRTKFLQACRYYTLATGFISAPPPKAVKTMAAYTTEIAVLKSILPTLKEEEDSRTLERELGIDNMEVDVGKGDLESDPVKYQRLLGCRWVEASGWVMQKELAKNMGDKRLEESAATLEKMDAAIVSRVMGLSSSDVEEEDEGRGPLGAGSEGRLRGRGRGRGGRGGRVGQAVEGSDLRENCTFVCNHVH